MSWLDAIRGLGKPAPKRVLVTGGARSGKSRFAERLLEGHDLVEYVATADPEALDAEFAARVDAHRRRRPDGWTTTETCDLVGVLGRPGPPVLIDCLSLWLAHACERSGLWEEAAGADAALARVIDELVDAWGQSPRRIVAVTNEVGSGVVPDTLSGRRYRDELGILNARIAAVSTEIWLVVAGRPLRLP